jgi:predicted lipid-binding transport protein (Tim44 family)
MQDVFDLTTLILLALAVLIFLRLRSVLGQRTGRERPPYDPFSAREPVRGSAGDKVVTLPTRAVEQGAKGDKSDKPVDKSPEPSEPPEPVERWKGIAPQGSAVANGLDAILAVDKSFDPRHFLTGARAAYEMIVIAFAQGDRRTLKEWLAKEVYDSFESVIQERENHGETTETRFVTIDSTEIAGAEVRSRNALVTVRFVTQLVSATRDKSGTVTDGNPDKVSDVTDVWTFARDTTSRDPNWKLVATEAGH